MLHGYFLAKLFKKQNMMVNTVSDQVNYVNYRRMKLDRKAHNYVYKIRRILKLTYPELQANPRGDHEMDRAQG